MDPNSYLQTGIDNTDILNLQQDTQDRFNKLFQGPQNLPGLHPFDPDAPLGKEGVVNPGTNINIPDINSLYSELRKSTIKSGTNEFLFDSDEFVKKSDASKYIDEKFGYALGKDNEDWYAKNQGGWERLGKGLVGFATKTLTDFGKAAGYTLGLVSPWNWDKNWIGNAADNSIAKISQNIEDKVLQDWLPQYQEASDRGKGIVWRMFHDENFWTEDVVDLAAFTTSAYLTSGLGVGLKLGPKLGTLMHGMEDLKTAEGFLTAAGRTANTIDRGVATAMSTVGESMFEAKSVRDNVYQNQINQGADEQTAREASSKAAQNTFFGNIALLSASNWWETGIFFHNLKNTSKAAVKLGENTIVDNVALKAPDVFEKILSNKWTQTLKIAGEGFAVEGLYEENGQLAISRNAEAQYSQKDAKDRNVGFLGSIGNVFSRWYNQTKDAYKGKDEEAFENIFLGGLFGSVMGAGEMWLHKSFNEKHEDALKVVAEINAAKGQWLKRSDIYDVGTDGKLQFNEEKFIGAMYGNMDATTKQQLANHYKDENNKEVAKKDAFASYALAHFKAGTQEKLLSELDSINQLTPDQLVKIGLNPGVDDLSQKIGEYKNFTNKLKDVYDSIEKHYKYNGADPNIDIYRRDYIFGLAAKEIAFREQSGKVQSNIDTISNKMGNSSISDNLVDNINQINTKIKIQENNVKLYQDKKYAQRILDKLNKQKDNLEQENEDVLKKINKDSDGYYHYENKERNSDILSKELQENIVHKASLDTQADNIKSAFDKYANKKEGYDAFYNEIVKPEVESMIKAKDEIAEKEKAEQNKTDKQAEGEANVPTEQTPEAPKPPEEPNKTDRQDLPETPVNTEAKNIRSLVDSTDVMNRENHQYLNDKINKSLSEGKISPNEHTNIKKVIDTRLDSEGEDTQFLKDLDKPEEKPTEEQSDDSKQPHVSTGENSGDYNPDAEEDKIPDSKEDAAYSLVAYKTSNKTVTQEELTDDDGKYNRILDEDPYKQFKQNFIREKLSYEGALFQYGARIIKDNPNIPKEKKTADLLKTNPSILGSVLVITDSKGNTLYFDSNYNESIESRPGHLPIAYSFTDKYWARDQDFRAFIGQERTGKSVDEFISQYNEEAKQRDMARKLNNLGVDIPVSLTGFNQGAMQYGKESRVLRDIIKNKPITLLVAGSKDAATGEKFTIVNGQKLTIGGFYGSVDGKFFRLKPGKISEVKLDLGTVADSIVEGMVTNFARENDAQFVANYISKVLFVNRPGRPEIKIFDNKGSFVIRAMLNGKTMTLGEFNSWLDSQYLNIHSDSLGQIMDVPVIGDGSVLHKSIDYNKFVIDNSRSNIQGINTKDGIKIMPLNSYITFDIASSNEVMKNEIESREAGRALPFDEGIQSATETEEESSNLKNVPDYIKEEIQRNVVTYAKFIPQIKDLAYQGLTKGEIAHKLDIPGLSLSEKKEVVNSLRTYLDIPSMDFKEEFEQWKDKIDRERTLTPQEKQEQTIKESPKGDTSITGQEIQEKPKFEEFNEKQKSPEEIQNEINKFRDQNRLERGKENLAGELIGQSEVDHVRQIFGDKLNIEHLQNIVDANAWGTWTQAGIILYKDAPVGTGYHEAWHQFSQLYLTQGEKKSLYNEVRSKVKELKNAPDFEVEEAVAEDFRKYTKGESTLNGRPQRNTIFRKILDFLKRFFFGSINISKLYDDLYRGNLKSYTPSINNALFGKLNSKIINPSTGLEVLDNQKTGYYMNVIDVLLGDQLLSNNAGPAIMNSNPRLASYFYQNVKADLVNNHYNVELQKFKEGKPYNEELLKDLQNILANWNSVTDYHKEHSRLGVYIEEDLPEVDDSYNPKEELDNADRDEHKDAEFGGDKQLFDRKGNEESSMQSASDEIRALIRLLPEVEPVLKEDGTYAYNIKLDANGFAKLNDYSKTWNNIAIELAGDISYERMYKRLTYQSTLDKIPEAVELKRRLPDPMNITNPEQRDMVLKFTQAFAKSYVPINTVLKDGNRYLLMEETNRNRDSIQKLWSSNFIGHSLNSSYVQSDLLLQDELGRNYVNTAKRFNYKFTSQAEVDSFLSLLGIEMSARTKKDPKYRANIVPYVKVLQNALNMRLANNIKVSDPISDLGKDLMVDDENIIPGVRRITNAILNLESKYSSTNPSMSYQTAAGEIIYGLSYNNTLTLHSYFLNSANTLDQLYSRPETLHLNPNINPYVRNSVYLNALFDFETGKKRLDKYGNPIRLLVNNYNGTKEITNNGTIGKSTADLNQREKMVMDPNSLLTSGLDEIMRTESSSSAWAVGLSAYDSSTDKKLPLSIENFERGYNNSFTNIWQGYIYDELYRMKNADSITLPNFPKESAKEFNLNYDILTPEIKSKLKSELGEAKDITNLIAKHEKEINKSITDFFDKETEKLKRRYSDENITKKDFSSTLWKYNFDQLIRAFVANDFIKNVEYTKLIAGDTIYQAHYKDYHKRAKGNISTGTITVTDNWFASYMQAREKNTFAGSIGVQTNNDYKRTQTYNLKDDIRSSKYHDAGILQADLKAVSNFLSNEEIDKLLKSYSDLNVADGQGHVTLDFYRQFLISRGNWPVTQEIAYQKELAWFRLNYSDMIPGYDNDKKKADEDYIKKHESIQGYFPPMKVQYDGPIVAEGTYAPVMDKFSVAPLIPSVIKGKAWEKVNLELIKKGNVGYTKFESGTKKFKYTPVDIYQEIDGKKTFSPQFDQVEPAMHFLTYLKEQINTSFKVKEDTRFGSQIRKLILANLFSNGVGSQKSLNRINRYKDILNKFQDQQKSKLFKRIGIEEAKGGFTIKNMNKFISQIQFEAKRQGLNDNIIDYIQYDKDSKGVVYPLESSLNRGPIQDLVMGMIDRELRIHKMNGDMAIQVSSSGYEDNDFKYTNADKEDIKKYGTNGLSFYNLEYDENGKPTKTTKMQVKVALVGSFKKLLNRADVKEMSEAMQISPLEALNRLIKTDSWIKENEKAISLVGYRIPTQGINSMENMIVQEFLPSVAGSIIIPPAEIVAKSGSDYDIDKLNIFKPSLTNDGEYIDTQEGMKNKILDKINSLEKKIEQLRQGSDYFDGDKNVNKLISAMFGINEEQLADIEDEEVSSNMKEVMDSYNELQDLEKGYLSNQIIELYDEILSDPEMFSQLITPNSTDLIKDQTNDLSIALGKRRREDVNKGKQGYLRTQIYRAVNNYRKFESLLEGKKFLGVFATNNTLSQILQQNDIRMDQSYTHPWVKDINGRPFKMNVNLLLLNNVERKKVIGENGKIKLGEKNNVEGNLKQDFISQLVNATVDIASDDFIGYINLNWENIGVTNYLLQVGVPYDRIISFINQPIMQRYYEMLRKNPDLKPREVQMELYEELTKDQIPRNKNTGKRNSQYFIRIMQYMERELANNYFDKDKMFQRIKTVGNKYNDFLYDNPSKDAKNQIYFFAHFLNLQDQAKQMRSFQSVINFDTNKLASPIDAYTQLLNRSNVAKVGMFDAEQVNKVTNDSIISIFNNNKIIGDIFSQIMPSAYKQDFLKMASSVMNQTYLSNKDKKRVTKLLVNDWVEFLVKNFGQYDNKNISEAGAALLNGERGKVSLARKAIEMKEKYPDLVSEYNIFNKLFPNFGNRKRKIDNLEINRVFENSVEDQNRYIDEFRKLINFSDPRYSIDQQAEIRKFFKDVALLGFFQSGFNKSPISFQELIPYEQFANIFRDSLYNFEEVVRSNPRLLGNLLAVFAQRFKINNAKYFGKKGTAEPFRLKNYGIRDDATINEINKIMAANEKLRNAQIPKPAEIAAKINPTEEEIKPATETTEQDEDNDESDYTEDNTAETSEEEVNQPGIPTKGVELFKGYWTRKFVEAQKDKVFLFGDNTADKRSGYIPTSTQAVIRGLPNAIGISTKLDRGTNESSYLKDSLFDLFKKHLDEQIQKAKDSGKTIVIPADGIGTGKAELEKRAPRIFAYLKDQLDKLVSGSKQENPADIAREQFNDAQQRTIEDKLENSPETSQYKQDQKEQSQAFNPQQENIKKANDFLQANDYTYEEWYNENKKDIEEAYALSGLDEKELKKDYQEEKQNKSQDRYEEFFSYDLDKKIASKYGFGVGIPSDQQNLIDVNKILKFYQNELYSNEEEKGYASEKQQLEDFFKQFKIDPTYNPNQLSLFNDEINQVIKDKDKGC